MEKISYLEKDTKIKSLEDLVVKMGSDPEIMKAGEELIKKNNVDIVALRKQMKLPVTEDPLSKYIEESETQKGDTMKLIMEQNSHIRQMETEMEKMIKEKEQSSNVTMVPLDVVPLTTIPTTGVATSTTPSAQSTDVVDQLTKAVENLSI